MSKITMIVKQFVKHVWIIQIESQISWKYPWKNVLWKIFTAKIFQIISRIKLSLAFYNYQTWVYKFACIENENLDKGFCVL